MRTSRRDNRHQLTAEFDLATCSIATISLLALSAYTEQYPEEILAADWISDTRRPNPNHVLQGQLLQITNFSLSILLLLERGLDNPARALLRTVNELSHQTLVLLSSQEDMRVYVTGHDEDSSNKAWFKLFGRGLLNRKLSALESRVGFSSELTIYTQQLRQQSERFYGQAVHHSYVATMVGSYSQAFRKRAPLVLGLLGSENKNIETPLRDLNTTLWYFILMFFAVLDRILRVRPRHPEHDFWTEAFILHVCVRELYSGVYPPKQRTRRSSSRKKPT